jgi:hypothetical protein
MLEGFGSGSGSVPLTSGSGGSRSGTLDKGQRDLKNFDFNPCTVQKHICSNVRASCDTLIEEPGSMPLGLVVGSGTATVELENPEPGRVEIDPDSLWEKVTKVCTSCQLDSNQILKSQFTFLFACDLLSKGVLVRLTYSC